MNHFVLNFYETENGKIPAKEFILSLDVKMRAKVLRYLEILKESGNALREPYTKGLGDGIFELRIKQGSDISRVLYFFMAEKRIIITNGFIKKSQNVPKGEVELAKKYRKNYLERVKEE